MHERAVAEIHKRTEMKERAVMLERTEEAKRWRRILKQRHKRKELLAMAEKRIIILNVVIGVSLLAFLLLLGISLYKIYQLT